MELSNSVWHCSLGDCSQHQEVYICDQILRKIWKRLDLLNPAAAVQIFSADISRPCVSAAVFNICTALIHTMTCWTLQLIVLLVNCLGEIFNAATRWTLDTADISPGGVSQPSISQAAAGCSAHVSPFVSRWDLHCRDHTAVQQRHHQSKNCNFGIPLPPP